LAKLTEQKNEDNFNEYCPKLSDKQAKYLENDLSLKELQEALSSLSSLAQMVFHIWYIRNIGTSWVQSSQSHGKTV
jgi:hypothetical protein